jgi:hypothetical protein
MTIVQLLLTLILLNKITVLPKLKVFVEIVQSRPEAQRPHNRRGQNQ